jgi:hypothetical protein
MSVPMSDRLPPEITVTELPNGVRFCLPARSARQLRFDAHAWFFIGLFVLAFAVYLFVSFCGIEKGSWYPPSFFLAICGALLLVAGISIGHGVWLLTGHSEIELSDGTLAGFECWGQLRWCWQRPVAGLRRFEVREVTRDATTGTGYGDAAAATECNAITPIWEENAQEQPKQLARGYPRAWLMPLATALAQRCQPRAADTPAPIAVTQGPLPNSSGFVEQLEQPITSQFRVQVSPDIVLLTPRQSAGSLLGVELAVVRGELRVSRQKAFRVDKRSWARHQVADIRVGRQEEHDGPDTFLLVIEPYPGEGKPFRLNVHGEADARWLATTLHRALRLPDLTPEQKATAFLERDQQPAGSRIVLERTTQRLTLSVPATGLWYAQAWDYSVSSVLSAGITALCAALIPWFEPEGVIYTFLIIMGPALFLIALVCFVEAYRRATRAVALTVVGDTLFARLTSLFGTRIRQWRRTSVSDIRVGRTVDGTVSNPRIRQMVLDSHDPTWELQIHLKNGNIVRMLDDYGDAELQWLATMVRRALLPSGSAAEPHRDG